MQVRFCLEIWVFEFQFLSEMKGPLSGSSFLIFFIIVTLELAWSSILKLGLKQYAKPRVSEIVTLVHEFNASSSDFVVRNLNETITVLWCEGDEPVEWSYSGHGSPNLVKEDVKIWRNATEGEGRISKAVSELKFRADGNLKKRIPFHTGRYTCRSVRNSSLEASVHLFFPGSDRSFLLLPSGKRVNTILHPQTNDGRLNLPCLLTDPSVNISLYKQTEENGDGFNKIENATYDPKSGFQLQFQRFESSLGQYKCVAGFGKRGYAVFHVIEDKGVRVYPNETLIFPTAAINLTCEAIEPVRIKLVAYTRIDATVVYYVDGEEAFPSNLETHTEEIESETEETELGLHIANHMEVNNSVGDMGEFQCISDVDGRVFHSWIYEIISPEDGNITTGIKYHDFNKSFTCQTKISSHGKLSFVLCESPSECSINKNCFQQNKNCVGYKKLPGIQCDWKKDCREIVHYTGTGFIRCSEDGVEEVVAFADLPRQFYVGKDLDSIPVSEGAILYHESNEVRVGDILRIYLKKWRYMFLSEHKWAARFNNDSVVYNVKYRNYYSAKFEILEEMKAVEVTLLLRNFSTFPVVLPLEIVSKRTATTHSALS